MGYPLIHTLINVFVRVERILWTPTHLLKSTNDGGALFVDIKDSLLTLSAFGIFVSSCTSGTGASDPLAGIEKAQYSLDVSFTETAKANPVANLSKEQLQRFNGSASKTAHENALSFKSIDGDPLFLLEGFKGYTVSVLECVGYPAEGGFRLTNRTYQIDLETTIKSTAAKSHTTISSRLLSSPPAHSSSPAPCLSAIPKTTASTPMPTTTK